MSTFPVRAPAPFEPTDPRQLGGYELLGRLGAGGTGTVTIPVDTSRGSCFVRAQVRRGGVLVASGNPMWFLVREPGGGVPASRRVAQRVVVRTVPRW